MTRELYGLENSRVRLLDSEDTGITLLNISQLTLTSDVKAQQNEDPVLASIKRVSMPHLPTGKDRKSETQRLITGNGDPSMEVGIRTTCAVEDYAKLYLMEIVRHYGIPVSIILDRGTQFTAKFLKSFQESLGTRANHSMAFHPQSNEQAERTIQTLEDMLRACVLDFQGSCDDHLPLIEFSYNYSYHASIKMASYEALYGRKCRSPAGWFKVGEENLFGPDLVYQAIEKGVMWFGMKGKLSPRYIEHYRIVRKVGQVAYEFELPSELQAVHPVFHVSMLRKCIADPSRIIHADEIQVTENLMYEEEPISILDRQVRRLRNKDVALVKVLWWSKDREEMTWEAKVQMNSKYPHLFPATYDTIPEESLQDSALPANH
ncbi:uncharacterized protein LOC132607804 [Lycium barbarum]|uniref:uncharacterized protein LOC132607804 n=1 Tax=Lycium barbarum TaxID=112863 RepID=UPI00293F7004|nr:uncharacterized protein LOC132607804 [Lycium barbarum]